MEVLKTIHMFFSLSMLLLIHFSSSDCSDPNPGGGASGCPLAATLSEKFSVLLIERGGSPYDNPLILYKKNYGISLIQTDEFSSISQGFTSLDGVSNHRGRVLGGGTSINGGFYSRASDNYVKTIGWDKKLVMKAYQWVESRIVSQPELSFWQKVAMKGLIEAGNLPNGFSLEHIEGTKIGGSIFDNDGKRHAASDLLMAGNPINIIVLLNATVKNVIFHEHGKDRICVLRSPITLIKEDFKLPHCGSKNKPIAYGIKFIKSNGDSDQEYEAYLNQRSDSSSWGDVILSAGTLGSPQILLLSGIGPKQKLEKFKIPTTVDLKGVGQDMKDNPAISIRVLSKLSSRKADPPQVVGIANDYIIVVQPIILPLNSTTTMVIVASKVAFPSSKGNLELNNTDPRQNPLVKFNYLSDKQDLEECVEISKLLQKIEKTKSIKLFLGKQYDDNVTTNEDEMRKNCLKNVRTFYHYHGGCNVRSVVDKEYKVYGVDGLRVVDGSTFLESPGTNPMATILMLGRYQGIKILKERHV